MRGLALRYAIAEVIEIQVRDLSWQNGNLNQQGYSLNNVCIFSDFFFEVSGFDIF